MNIDPKILVADKIIHLIITAENVDDNAVLNMLIHHISSLVAAHYVAHMKHGCANDLPDRVVKEVDKEIWDKIKEICEEHNIELSKSHNQKLAEELLREMHGEV
jgi:hypothetical protein